jgi:signal transduction histidine kinase
VVAAPQPRVPIWTVLTDDLLTPILQGGLVALALSLLAALAVARWIGDPLQRLVGAARGFPSEHMQPLPERGPHEVRGLTRAFNAMIGRVQESRRAQREFVANVSHELKTPLTSIQGFAQAILDGTADTPAARSHAAEVIYAEAGRMHRMVLNLLDLARLDTGTADLRMAPVDVPALLDSIREKFEPQAARSGVTLELQLAGALPTLMGDGDRLAQVFTNLVDNALKFTSAGGRVRLRASQDGGWMLVEVEDTGQGIPKQALARIFDRFYQVDPARSGGAGRGAGLGLAIVREFVQAHGGRISVRSQPGNGTLFTLSLPLSQPAAQSLVSHDR